MAARKVVAQISLVTIPLRLEKAIDDEDGGTEFHAVCTGSEEEPHEPSRVVNRVTCLICGRFHSSVFGYPLRGTENGEGKLVVVTAEEMNAAKGAPITGKPDCPMVVKFHPREKVYGATVAGGSVNNLTPDRGGERGYAALRDTLKEHPELVACCIWAPRTKNALWVIEVVDERLVIASRAWPEVVRPAPAVAPVDLLAHEVAMFNAVVESQTADFDLSEYANKAQMGLQELVASRAGTAVPITENAPVAVGGDWLAGLEASLQVAKPRAKAPAKKAAAKKTATPRKRAAKKAVTIPKQRTA